MTLKGARDEIMRASWGRCVSTVVREDGTIVGRCSGNRIEAHHDVRRSEGGPDTADNLLPWCSRCHGKLEREGKRSVRSTRDKEGRRYWVEGEDRIYDWRDLEDSLQAEYINVEKVKTQACYHGCKAAYRLAYVLWRVKDLALWELDTDVDSWEEYVRSLGMKPKSSTVRNYVWMGRRLYRDLEVSIAELDRAVGNAAHNHGQPPLYSSLRASLKDARELSKDEFLVHIQTSPASQLPGAVSEAAERGRARAAKKSGRTRYLCRANATATFELAMTMDEGADEETLRAELRKRIAGALARVVPPGEGMIQWQEGSFTAEKGAVDG